MADEQDIVLYGYFRSGTSYRVRIALNWKGVPFQYQPVNLLTGAHQDAEFLARNPQALVPALSVSGTTLTQSPAILEWIEETWPDPALLPDDPVLRARVRAFAAVVACDVHPIQNLRVMKKIRADFGQDQDGALDWARHWIATGFEALEALAGAAPGANGFLFADTATMAEVYLVPQMFNARRFGVDLSAFPRLVAADAAASALPAFEASRPEVQPDAPADA
ncbi:MAG: maleylacetoacetate isomerase [Pseudomonadota bacterium]